MKTLRTILFLLITLASARAADVHFDFKDIAGGADYFRLATSTNRLRVTPTPSPLIGGSSILGADWIERLPTTNGEATVTNLQAGVFYCAIKIRNTETHFTITVTNYVGTIEAKDIVTTPTNGLSLLQMAYTMGSSDARYIWSLGTPTNGQVLTYNAASGRYYPSNAPAGGGGGGGGDVTTAQLNAAIGNLGTNDTNFVRLTGGYLTNLTATASNYLFGLAYSLEAAQSNNVATSIASTTNGLFFEITNRITITSNGLIVYIGAQSNAISARLLATNTALLTVIGQKIANLNGLGTNLTSRDTTLVGATAILGTAGTNGLQIAINGSQTTVSDYYSANTLWSWDTLTMVWDFAPNIRFDTGFTNAGSSTTLGTAGAASLVGSNSVIRKGVGLLPVYFTGSGGSAVTNADDVTVTLNSSGSGIALASGLGTNTTITYLTNRTLISNGVALTIMGRTNGVSNIVEVIDNTNKLLAAITPLGGFTSTDLIIGTNFQANGVTASRAVYFDSLKRLTSSATTDTELGYLSGVTSALQTQLGAKLSLTAGNTISNDVVNLKTYLQLFFPGANITFVTNNSTNVTISVKNPASLTNTLFYGDIHLPSNQGLLNPYVTNVINLFDGSSSASTDFTQGADTFYVEDLITAFRWLQYTHSTEVIQIGGLIITGRSNVTSVGMLTTSGMTNVLDYWGRQVNARIAPTNATASRVIVTDPNGVLTNSPMTSAELLSVRAGMTNYANFWIGAGAFWPAATNQATNSTFTQNGTNQYNADAWAFDDTTNEFIQCSFMMPDEWDLGAVKMKLVWGSTNTTTSGNTNVVWEIQAGAVRPGVTVSNLYSTQYFITNGLRTNYMLNFATSQSLTVDGTPAIGDLINIQIGRKGTNSTDTLGGDAKLLGVGIQYRKSMTFTNAVW